MATKGAERVRLYKQRMKAAGFQRLSFWVSPELAAKLDAEGQSWECYGRTIERLVLGEAAKRPKH